MAILRDRVHELWWSQSVRFGNSGSSNGTFVFGDEQRRVCVCIQLFERGSRLNEHARAAIYMLH